MQRQENGTPVCAGPKPQNLRCEGPLNFDSVTQHSSHFSRVTYEGNDSTGSTRLARHYRCILGRGLWSNPTRTSLFPSFIPPSLHPASGPGQFLARSHKPLKTTALHVWTRLLRAIRLQEFEMATIAIAQLLVAFAAMHATGKPARMRAPSLRRGRAHPDLRAILCSSRLPLRSPVSPTVRHGTPHEGGRQPWRDAPRDHRRRPGPAEV